ncbi:hypothetical protein BM1_02105 [Bipolaris maydis]|nr:hypothetical protein BM1_02105 [Bipolaris maydis]
MTIRKHPDDTKNTADFGATAHLWFCKSDVERNIQHGSSLKARTDDKRQSSPDAVNDEDDVNEHSDKLDNTIDASGE